MIRFLFHGGTREKNDDGSIRSIGIAHNSAFYFAALNVQRDYKDGDKRSIKITTAADMVAMINACRESSIASLDILCHGTPYSINFSIKENENCGLVTNMITMNLIRVYYSIYGREIYSFSSDSRYVSDINFSVFTNDARIQIHGCNTARGAMPGGTLTEAFSEQLFAAGKRKSYAIGHTDESNPQINGSQTTNTQQDYRHGRRSVYHNGKVIHSTTQKGLVPHEEIQGMIK